MHFLIVKTSSLGDILHAFPALSYLRKKFPNAKIDWVLEKSCASLITSHPEIDTVFFIDTKLWRKNFLSWKEIRNFCKDIRKTKYDVVFDLQGNTKSGLILSIVKAKKKVGFGKKSVHEWPNLFFTNFKAEPSRGVNIREDQLYVVKKFFNDETASLFPKIRLKISSDEKKILEELKKGPKILVCPGAYWKNKQLPLEKWKKLLKDPFFVAWGNEKEHVFAQELVSFYPDSVVLPKLSLPLLQNLMAEMDLVIAMDSLPLHLAATTGVKTMSFFGPTLGTKFAPVGHEFHQGKCPYNVTFEKRCPRLRSCKTGACMHNIVIPKNFWN